MVTPEKCLERGLHHWYIDKQINFWYCGKCGAEYTTVRQRLSKLEKKIEL